MQTAIMQAPPIKGELANPTQLMRLFDFRRRTSQSDQIMPSINSQMLLIKAPRRTNAFDRCSAISAPRRANMLSHIYCGPKNLALRSESPRQAQLRFEKSLFTFAYITFAQIYHR
jgi:hypothetical protein